MKQQNIKFLYALVACMLGINAFAHDIAVANADGMTIYYNYINKTELAVTFRGSEYYSHSGDYSSNVVIPESVTYNGNTYSVTSIDRYAFYGSWCLSVTIPNSVTSIGEYAFQDCSGLTNINIPTSVTSIGQYAFLNCWQLTSITVPNSVTNIGNNAFGGTAWYENQPDGLVYAGKVVYKYKGKMPPDANIVLEEGTLGIAGSAFQYCSGLTGITIPNSVTSIGEYAFQDCSGLTSVNIPSSLTSIDFGSFLGCSSLTSVKVPVSEFSAFCRVVNLVKDEIWKPIVMIDADDNEITEYSIPEGVTSIGDYAFYRCIGLTSVNIPNSVTSIGYDAFYECCSLTNVIIGNSVTNIGSGAFYGCSNLMSITIPNSVTSIGNGAFSKCSGLNSITVENGNTKYNSRNYCNAIIETSTNILVGGCMNTVIPNSVTSIGESAFSGCSSLTSIDIPNSVTTIKGSAFRECSSLTSINIPNSVTSIGGYAFSGCSGLTCVTIPNSVTSISGSTFSGCSGLTSITIPNSVTGIGGYAFNKCSSLTNVTIGNSVASIGESAFSGCDKIRSVISKITKPFDCDSNAFPKKVYRNGTLYVPAGTKDLYKRFYGWGNFFYIEEVGGEAVKYHLSFVVNNKELSSKEVEAGATITAPTTDSEGNTVSWYTYPATMPAHDLVVYGMVVRLPEPEVLVWLTVKDGRGTTKMKVRKGTEQVLTITPEEGWKVVSVTLDGIDVTAQVKDGSSYTTPAIMNDATLFVVYEQDAPSDVASSRAGQATVKVVDDGVVITHAEPQSRCVVYTSNGEQVVSTVIEGDNQKIRLQKGQVYILTINRRTLKFAL